MSPSKHANHLKAPWAAGIVGNFRQVFGGDVTVIHVHEGEVEIGKPTVLTDVELVSIPGKMKGKKQLPSVQFTIVRTV